jgi:hypothetical protein
MLGHVRVMGIIEPSLLRILECFNRITAPEENNMGN